MALMSSVNVTSLDDVVTAVLAFANTVGFTVASNVIQRPDDGAAVSFALSKFTGTIPAASHAVEGLEWDPTSPASNTARMVSPNLLVGVTVTIQAPTKVTMFGSLTPQPYIAIVVSYGFNLYRHLYCGYAEILGAYTGGAIASGSAFADEVSSTVTSYLFPTVAHLFGARQSYLGTTYCGGMQITHADNPNTWRLFSMRARNTGGTSNPVTCVFGGFGDNVNDCYVGQGQNTFASSKVLSPINLYVGRASDEISPVGRPPGVRLVNMDGIDPEAVIAIGGSNWKCFPQFAKSLSTTAPAPTVSGIGRAQSETSYMVGLAYLAN